MLGHGLTIHEAALSLGVSERTVHRHIRKGLLEARKEGGKVYVTEDSLRHFDKAKHDKIDTAPAQFDPIKHVIIERREWEGMLTRLSQLEVELRIAREAQKLIEDSRPWWKRIFQ